MRTGTYETADGERVHVQRTDTGYRLTYGDGTTTMIGSAR